MERLYRYAVIKRPTEQERKEGKRAEVIVPPSEYALYRSEQEVVMAATKAIPDKQMKHADRLEVAVSPF